MNSHICVHTYFSPRGYRDHIDPETDSDTDGGSNPKLTGLGHIEFSQKGIPHDSLHFPEQLKWAGHIFMHDTCAPEASHKINIKKAMDRVRKSTDEKTSASMIEWRLRVRTWGKIITMVKNDRDEVPKRSKRTRTVDTLTVVYNASKILSPTRDIVNKMSEDSFSPLIIGGDNLLTPDARISYNEVRETHTYL